eukprot:7454588-Alexandrium_andersonii.AAC.1
MSASLVGSEMCIRDRDTLLNREMAGPAGIPCWAAPPAHMRPGCCARGSCLLYTSDAADDM